MSGLLSDGRTKVLLFEDVMLLLTARDSGGGANEGTADDDDFC